MTTQEMLDERYGLRRSARSRRVTWIVAAAVGVLAAGALAWMVWTDAAGAARADTTGFELVDPHSVSLTFQVTAPPGSSIACALEAQDTQHGIVGWQVVQYPPSTSHARAFTEAIPTVAEATTGLVNACWVL